MSFFTPSSYLIGLEKTSEETYNVAILETYKNGWKVIDVKEISLASSSLREALNIERSRHLIITIAVDAKHLLTRPLSLPITRHKDIEATYALQAEPLLPYPLEEAICRYQILKQDTHKTDLILYSIKKQTVGEAFSQLPYEPDCMTTTAHALSMLYPRDHHLCAGIIHVRNEQGTCIIMQEDKLVASHTFNMTEVESKLLLMSCKKRFNIETIYVTGEAQHTFLLDIIPSIGSSCQPLIPSSLFGVADHLLEQFGLAMGIAASGAAPWNFLVQQPSLKKQWRHACFPILSTLLLAILIYSGERLLQHFLLRKQTVETHQMVEEFAAYKQYPPSSDDLEERIALLEANEQALKQKFPFVLQVPRMLDVLSFFATHTACVDAHGNPTIELLSIEYGYEKMPDLQHPTERALVKVVISFTTDQPYVAHAVYEGMSKQHALINPNKEIEWRVDRQTYTLGFYLKDKTIYE